MNNERTERMKLLGGLADLFERPLTAPVIEIYLSVLSDLSLEQIRESCSRAARQCKFFPKPVELRELVQDSSSERGERAWRLLVEACKWNGDNSVYFADNNLAHAVLALWGTWIACYEDLVRLSSEMEASRRKEFLVIYRMIEKRDAKEDARNQPGRLELSNRENFGGWRQRWLEEGRRQFPMEVTAIAKEVSRIGVMYETETARLADDPQQLLSSAQTAIEKTH